MRLSATVGNSEQRLYLWLLWFTGASQTDEANLPEAHAIKLRQRCIQVSRRFNCLAFIESDEIVS